MQLEFIPLNDYTDPAHGMSERSTRHKARFRSTRTHQLFKNRETGYVHWHPRHPDGFIIANKLVQSLEYLKSIGCEPISESTYLGNPDSDWVYQEIK